MHNILKNHFAMGIKDFLHQIYGVLNYFPQKIFIILALAFSQVSALSTPVLTGKVIDTLSVYGLNASRLVNLFIALFIIYSVGCYFRYLLDNHLEKSLLEFGKNLRLRLWDSFGKISIGEYESTGRGVIHSKITRDVDILSMSIRTIIESILPSMVVWIGAIIITLYWQPLFLLVIFAALVVNFGVYLFFQKSIGVATCAVHSSNENLYRSSFELIEMIPLFRVFSVMDQYRNHYMRNLTKNLESNRKLNQVSIQYGTIIAFIGESARYSVFVTAVTMCYFNKISLGDVVLYQSLFSQALNGMCRLVFLLPRIQMGRESLRSLHPMLNIIKKVQQKMRKQKFNTEGVIEFYNVHFTYPKKSIPVLNGVTFSITSGEHTVILGKNGSGKSTLLRLLLGYYRQNVGTILIDGISNDEIYEDSFFRKIALVPQVSSVYRDSFLENIRLRDEAITFEKVMETVKNCNLNRLLMRLPSGIDEIITTQILSGGEMQCIAIARALARNPKILLLDEITSNLDIYSKRMIFDVLWNLRGSLTIITISHDLEFIKLADRVLIMDEGRLYHVNDETSPESISDIVAAFRHVRYGIEEQNKVF